MAGMISQGTTPPKAKGKKTSESADSPTMVEAMARREKLRPLLHNFMRLIT